MGPRWWDREDETKLTEPWQYRVSFNERTSNIFMSFFNCTCNCFGILRTERGRVGMYKKMVTDLLWDVVKWRKHVLWGDLHFDQVLGHNQPIITNLLFLTAGVWSGTKKQWHKTMDYSFRCTGSSRKKTVGSSIAFRVDDNIRHVIPKAATPSFHRSLGLSSFISSLRVCLLEGSGELGKWR